MTRDNDRVILDMPRHALGSYQVETRFTKSQFKREREKKKKDSVTVMSRHFMFEEATYVVVVAFSSL